MGTNAKKTPFFYDLGQKNIPILCDWSTIRLTKERTPSLTIKERHASVCHVSRPLPNYINIKRAVLDMLSRRLSTIFSSEWLSAKQNHEYRS